MSKSKGKTNEPVPTRICVDEDCPECGWPERYAEVDFTKPTPGADAIGCNNCGWRIEANDG